MEHSPPSLTRSPVSSPNTNFSASPNLDYPSLDNDSPLYNIGLTYEQSCAVMPSHMDRYALPPLEAVTSAEWTGTTLIHAEAESGVPHGLSTDYDQFGNYEAAMHTPYSHDMYSSHPAQAPATLPSNARHLPSMSSRSPVSSSRHHFSYHDQHSVSPVPRLKMESAADYSSGGETQYPSPRAVHALPLPQEPGGYGSNVGSPGYLSDAPSGSWPRLEYPPHYYAGASGSGTSLLPDDKRQVLRASRSQRQPRKLTTKEEANFQCEVKGCGKLFSRSYNFKAHMETHDEQREYPFPCTVPDCNKKFVRKTDLQRHNQSVHMKERNHKCDFCSRLFARKDTLRRHMEDGCSKRFDIGTLDLREAEPYDSYHTHPRPLDNASGHLAAPEQLPPMTMPPLYAKRR
ncbi:Uu.00g063080.m01.CDS01 [Anthostomella pinea]|uniref:Uu.00g063080.m01.CDS01 n=1 Tax=Anthostomella pinea TaxID=933095 RepID=A0AAI8YMY0_9PEZI|nr:Uu.00g063080.m01.CDS01 [Anthostomella pinea]